MPCSAYTFSPVNMSFIVYPSCSRSRIIKIAPAVASSNGWKRDFDSALSHGSIKGAMPPDKQQGNEEL